MIDLFKHLLPSGRAWRLTVDTQLRQLFEGLAGVASDVRTFFDDAYGDLCPQETEGLEAWERQFALPSTGLTEQERRDRLAATWQAAGGQDPRYIEDTLRAAGFDVYVHEWWEPTVRSGGGSVNGDDVPTARNPFTYLWDGVDGRNFKAACGHDLAYCGGDSAFCNSQDQPAGYVLVNKLFETVLSPYGCGHDDVYCGGVFAAASAGSSTRRVKQYVIPSDPTKYPYFLYIGGQTFPGMAPVPNSRQDEFEDLCLKLCPTEQWLGILANYS